MSEKDNYEDGKDPGMSEGNIHSGPGGYEGMGYAGGYAADLFDNDDESEEENDQDEDDDDFDEDQANH